MWSVPPPNHTLLLKQLQRAWHALRNTTKHWAWLRHLCPPSSPPQALPPWWDCNPWCLGSTSQNIGNLPTAMQFKDIGPKIKPYLPKESKPVSQNVPQNTSGRQVCGCADCSDLATYVVLIHSDHMRVTICSMLSRHKKINESHPWSWQLIQKMWQHPSLHLQSNSHVSNSPSLTGQVFLPHSQQKLLWPHSFITAEHQQCAGREMSLGGGEEGGEKGLPEVEKCYISK